MSDINKNDDQQIKNIIMEKLIKLIEKYPDKDWNWEKISEHPYLTIEIIEKYIDKPWNWYYLTNNVSLDFVEKYPDKPLDWIYLTNHVSLEFVDKYLSLSSKLSLSYKFFIIAFLL